LPRYLIARTRRDISTIEIKCYLLFIGEELSPKVRNLLTEIALMALNNFDKTRNSSRKRLTSQKQTQIKCLYGTNIKIRQDGVLVLFEPVFGETCTYFPPQRRGDCKIFNSNYSTGRLGLSGAPKL
jgi:hypothetical protein